MSNLIVNDGKRYTVEPLYQWDKNQVLVIHGLNILKPEIHFINEAMSSTLVVTPTVDSTGVITVNVPNSLLQKPYSITVYVSGYEDRTFKTYCKVVVPVKKRARPGDYTIEATDGEIYSFNELSRRVSDLENSIKLTWITNVDEYRYDDNTISLDITTYSIQPTNTAIKTAFSSLNAIRLLTSKLKELITANTTKVEQALTLAKANSKNKAFDTTADMKAWLSDESNKGKCNVGDTLYIIDTTDPDWWITEVLDEVDGTTGFYYKVSELEVRNLSGTELWTNPDTSVEFAEQTISLDLSGYKSFRVVFKVSTSINAYVEMTAYLLNNTYMITAGGYANTITTSFKTIYRTFTLANNEVTFGPGRRDSIGDIENVQLIPYKIIGYKF